VGKIMKNEIFEDWFTQNQVKGVLLQSSILFI
jgi:hypothetical protein